MLNVRRILAGVGRRQPGSVKPRAVSIKSLAFTVQILPGAGVGLHCIITRSGPHAARRRMRSTFTATVSTAVKSPVKASVRVAPAFTGDFDTPATLPVRVLAAAHSGSTAVTTGRTAPPRAHRRGPELRQRLGAGEDLSSATAPSPSPKSRPRAAATGRSPAPPPACQRASCSTPSAPTARGAAPARSRGRYAAHPPPPPAGHRRSPSPPRTRTRTGPRADRDTLTFQVSVRANPTVASNPAPLTEANLDGAALTVTLPKYPSWTDGGSVRRIRALPASAGPCRRTR